MNTPDREAVELFLQEAAEHLQCLREYVSVLQDFEPRREDVRQPKWISELMVDYFARRA